MKININNTNKLLLSSALCTTLVACGGSTEQIIEDALNGLSLNSSNYQSFVQTGVGGSATIVSQLLFATNEIDTSELIVSSYTDNSYTYNCHNQGGTFVKTTIDDDTLKMDFSNCHITDYEPDSKYDGSMTISTVVNSGSLSEVGDSDYDWDITQTINLDNFVQTSPIDGGDSNTYNGDTTIDTSNDSADNLNVITMSSTNLLVDSIDASSSSVTSYSFSDLFIERKEDTSDESSVADLDFTAEISDIGDIQVTTDTALVTDSSGLLQSGDLVTTTGNSSIKMVAIGNDNVELSLDYDNDGSYDGSVSTTWASVYGE